MTSLLRSTLPTAATAWSASASAFSAPRPSSPSTSKGPTATCRPSPFYGLGPKSPAIKHTFHQNDTFGTLTADLPLTNHIAAEAALDIVATDVPPLPGDSLSVTNNFSPAAAPELLSQPLFVHPPLALRTVASALSNLVTNDDPDNHVGPLIKRNIFFTFNNSAEYLWQAAINTPAYSFQ